MYQYINDINANTLRIQDIQCIKCKPIINVFSLKMHLKVRPRREYSCSLINAFMDVFKIKVVFSNLHKILKEMHLSKIHEYK